jgi:putative transposase
MARRKQPVIPDQLLDQLLAGADAKAAFEKDGLLDELKKALAERAFERGDRSSPGSWRV